MRCITYLDLEPENVFYKCVCIYNYFIRLFALVYFHYYGNPK